MPLEPLAQKWRAFNWNVFEIDGHDFDQIDRAFAEAIQGKNGPAVIIANTISSKGIPEFEGKYEWHGKVPTTTEEIAAARKALNKKMQ